MLLVAQSEGGAANARCGLLWLPASSPSRSAAMTRRRWRSLRHTPVLNEGLARWPGLLAVVSRCWCRQRPVPTGEGVALCRPVGDQRGCRGSIDSRESGLEHRRRHCNASR